MEEMATISTRGLMNLVTDLVTAEVREDQAKERISEVVEIIDEAVTDGVFFVSVESLVKAVGLDWAEYRQAIKETQEAKK